MQKCTVSSTDRKADRAKGGAIAVPPLVMYQCGPPCSILMRSVINFPARALLPHACSSVATRPQYAATSVLVRSKPVLACRDTSR